MKDRSLGIVGQPTLYITLEPHFKGEDMVIFYRTGETTNRFQPGTVGEMRGLNCVIEPLPDTIEEILSLLMECGSSTDGEGRAVLV